MLNSADVAGKSQSINVCGINRRRFSATALAAYFSATEWEICRKASGTLELFQRGAPYEAEMLPAAWF